MFGRIDPHDANAFSAWYEAKRAGWLAGREKRAIISHDVLCSHTPLMPTLTLLGAGLVGWVVVSRAGARTDASGEYDESAVVERTGQAMGEFGDALSQAGRKRTGLVGW